MHYLGEKHYFQPVSQRFREFMLEHPWPEQIAVRKLALIDLWWGQLQWRWMAKWWLGTWDQNSLLHQLYPAEFLYPGHSAGLLWFPWIAVGAAINVAAAVLTRTFAGAAAVTRRLGPFVRPPAGQMRLGPAFLALAFASLSLSLNTVLRWRPPHSHELPYFELLLIGTVGLYLLRYLGLFYWLMALVAIVIRQAQYFGISASTTPLHLPAFDASGLLFWVVCAALIVPGFIVHDRADG